MVETAAAVLLAACAMSSQASADDAAIATNAAQGAAAAETQAQTPPQTQAQAPQTPPEVATIVVTGSRLAVRGYKAPTPVTTWSGEDIQLSGTQTVETLLQDSPQFVASQLYGPTSNTVPGGYAEINLRGFGEQRNLVLVNGRRYTIDGPAQTTDLDTIPAALVQKVEVVTGGSSAVYGSDAITGVVNFILNDKFQGAQFSAGNDVDQHTGTNSYNFDLTVGNNFADGRGNITASFDYLNRSGFTQGQRGGWAGQSLVDGCVTAASYSSTSAGTPMPVPGGETCVQAGGRMGFIFSGSGTIPNGRFTSGLFGTGNAAVNNALAAAGLTGLGGSGFTVNKAGTDPVAYASPADSYNLTPDAYLIDPLERKMANVFAHYDISPMATAYMEFHYSNNLLTAKLAPSSVSGNFLINDNNPYAAAAGLGGVLTALDNAEGPSTTINEGTSHLTTTPGDGLAILSINRRFSDIADRMATTNLDAYRFAGGVRGDLGSVSETFLSNLHYDAYYTYASTDEADHQTGAVSLSAFQNAILGATPLLDPFGQNLTPAAIKAISIQSTNLTHTDQEVLAATLTGVLAKAPAGPIDFDVGYEWRRAGTSFLPDQYLATGDVSGFNPQSPTAGSESVKEFYGELRVPLLADLPFAKRLNIQGAFRNSDYNLHGVGDVWTYSYGVEYAPVSDVTFRGQYQRAIRAPSVGELYGGQTASGPTLNDPCGPSTPAANQTAALKAACVATGVPANAVFTSLVQASPFIDVFTGGNPSLSAETSNTRTFGTVITPSMVRGLTLSVDYYSIDLSGAIAQLGGGAANALALCYNAANPNPSSVYCQAMHRDPQTGSLYGSGDYIEAGLVNIGYIRTTGIDFSGNYTRKVDVGFFSGGSRFTLSSDLNYTDSFDLKPSQSLPQVNHCVGAFGATCGQPIPQWKGVTRLTWVNGPLELSIRHRFVGAVTIDSYLLPSRSGGTAPPLSNFSVPTIPMQQYFDLTGVYSFAKRYQFTFGVQNIFDKDPPIIGSGGQPSDNTWAATYDIEGRVFFTNLKATF
jgi:outer membrane receptor protein involved in Fe transport